MMRAWILGLALLGCGGPVTPGSSTTETPFSLPQDGSLPALRKLRTEHIGRLTGTPRNPLVDVGIVGTDLGATFERDGKLVFIFGDSWTPDGRRGNEDSIAWTTATGQPAPGALPKLTWVTDRSNQFVAPRLSGVDLGGMNVPMEGVPAGAKTYVFLTTGWSEATHLYSHSVLAEMNGLDVAGMRVVHVVPSSKFINVSVVVEGDVAWVYGSGDYRKSDVYLARVELARLGDRDAWTYRDSSGAFVSGEANAAPMVAHACVGELSVRKWDSLGLYFMSYNCGAPRGINLRWARSPSGPWSDALVIFDPGRDGDHGYEHFMHANQDRTQYDDGLSETNREREWGGEYAPYLIPRYFAEESDGTLSLVYTLSSWNPYQVHLMRTRLGLPATVSPAPTPGAGLPPAHLVNADFSSGLSGWNTQGESFGVFTGADGKPRITTYVPPRTDALVGQLWQDFTVDANTRELRFFVHGGDAQVLLLDGDEVVRATHARRSNTPELPVVWQLSQLRGRTLRLAIDDSLTGPWGFISVSGFELR